MIGYSKGFAKTCLAVHVAAQLTACALLWYHTNLSTVYAIPLGWIAGVLLADFASGMAHFHLDNYGFIDYVTAKMPGLPFIAQYVAHHDFPDLILSYDYWTTNSDGLYATCITMTLTSLACLFYDIHNGFSEWSAFMIFALSSLQMMFFMNSQTNQFHYWSHQLNPPIFVRWLQKAGILLTFEEHRRHHIDPKTCYCISSGILNPFLEKIGWWGFLNTVFTAIIGEDKIKQQSNAEFRVERVKQWERELGVVSATSLGSKKTQ